MNYVSYIALLCSAITGVAAVVALVVSIAKKSTEPARTLALRIDELEERLNKHDEMLSADKNRLRVIEEGNRVVMRGVLALLKHGIDGNNVSDMELSKKELEEYLLNK